MNRAFPFVAFVLAGLVVFSTVGSIRGESDPDSSEPEPVDPAGDFVPPETDDDPALKITPREGAPTVRAIAPVEKAKAFFLTRRGRVGVAEFSPDFGLKGWEYYSRVRMNPLPSLAVGPGHSVLTANESELTQAFDTDRDVQLDFFQALLRDWPGRDAGVTITAGPVADSHGRVLLALSPHPPEEGATPRARIVAWHPLSESPVTVVESRLRIGAVALAHDDLLAVRLELPEYRDGYYVSLNELPPFDPDHPDRAPDPLPRTQPSFVIPAELTRSESPTQLCFLREPDSRKLIVTCPSARQLIEIAPQRVNEAWQGPVLLRSVTEHAVEALAEPEPGRLLGGGDHGFEVLKPDPDAFRIRRVELAEDGVVLDFTAPVDRSEAAKPESYSVRAVSLKKGDSSTLVVQPVIESDADTVILKTDRIEPGTVLRIVCRNVPAEDGRKLLSSAVFYTVHER